MTLRLEDCDTGESMLEIYEVPEGICITLGAADENTGGDAWRSCILSPHDATLLLEYLSMRSAKAPPPSHEKYWALCQHLLAIKERLNPEQRNVLGAALTEYADMLRGVWVRAPGPLTVETLAALLSDREFIQCPGASFEAQARWLLPRLMQP